jgi:hypothetical protein
MARAHVAQSVERFLGKEEVHRFDPGRGLHFSKEAALIQNRGDSKPVLICCALVRIVNKEK